MALAAAAAAAGVRRIEVKAAIVVVCVSLIKSLSQQGMSQVARPAAMLSLVTRSGGCCAASGAHGFVAAAAEHTVSVLSRREDTQKLLCFSLH